mgnify:FL=1
MQGDKISAHITEHIGAKKKKAKTGAATGDQISKAEEVSGEVIAGLEDEKEDEEEVSL